MDRRRTMMGALAVTLVALASGPAMPAGIRTALAAPERIGIIGTGRIGSALARHWAKAGHELMLSSRHPEELQALAAELGPRVRVGTPQQAAAFGQVIFVAIPYAAMPQVGNDISKELAGKVIIDASNPIERRDGAMALDAQKQGAGVASAALLHSKRIVRAFNCIGFALIASDAFRQPQRRVIPIGGDDAAAIQVATRLVNEAGFDVFVIPSLARTQLFDLGQPLASKDWTVAQYQAELAKL